jgi:hypothetical protein
LFGLTPEQIGGISRRDILGQEMLGRSSGEVFQNLVRQAQAGYYNRPDQPTAATSKESFTGLEKNANTGNYSYFDRTSNKMVDTGIKFTAGEKTPPGVNEHEYIGKDGIRRRGLFQGGNLIKDLGVTPESTIEDTRSFDIDKDLADIEDRIRSDNYVQSDIDNFNSRSKGNYFWVPGEGFFGGREAKKIPLPPGVKANDMYYTLQKHPEMSVEDVIKILK